MNESIRVPFFAYQGMGAVLNSGEPDMWDAQKAEVVAYKIGYPKTARWIGDNPKLYEQCMFDGFCSEDKDKEK